MTVNHRQVLSSKRVIRKDNLLIHFCKKVRLQNNVSFYPLYNTQSEKNSQRFEKKNPQIFFFVFVKENYSES